MMERLASLGARGAIATPAGGQPTRPQNRFERALVSPSTIGTAPVARFLPLIGERRGNLFPAHLPWAPCRWAWKITQQAKRDIGRSAGPDNEPRLPLGDD